MSRVAIIAAFAGELKPLVKGWKHESRNGVDLWRWRYDEGEWIAACAGAGVDAATRAFAEARKDGPVSLVISAGWAGALQRAFLPGRAYAVTGVIDARTGERFQSGRSEPGAGSWLVTSPTVADKHEKQRLVATYEAGMVDMEAAAVARLAAMRGIAFGCVKGISDGNADKLPDFNHFLSPEGRFRVVRFALFAFLRPWLWPALIRMGENSKKAARSIAESLFDFLDERGLIREQNGYPIHKR